MTFAARVARFARQQDVYLMSPS